MFAKGFAHTKLLEVLNAANVQKGNFYYYFGSKEELGLAVIHERGAKLIRDWLRSLIDGGEPWNNIERWPTG
jgi:AcrR family transcriptional regulator